MRKIVIIIVLLILAGCVKRTLDHKVSQSIPYRVHVSEINNIPNKILNKISLFYDKNQKVVVISEFGKSIETITDVKKIIKKNKISFSFLNSKNIKSIYLYKLKKILSCHEKTNCKLKVTENFTLYKNYNNLKIWDFNGDLLKFDKNKTKDFNVSDNFAYVVGTESLLWNFNGRNIHASYSDRIFITNNFALIRSSKGNQLLGKYKTIVNWTKNELSISNNFATQQLKNKNSELYNKKGDMLHRAFRKKFKIYDSYAYLDGFRNKVVYHKSSNAMIYNFRKFQNFIVNNEFLVIFSGKKIMVYNNNKEILYKNTFNTIPKITFINNFLIVKGKKLKFSVIHNKEGQLIFRYGQSYADFKALDSSIEVNIVPENKVIQFNRYGVEI